MANNFLPTNLSALVIGLRNSNPNLVLTEKDLKPNEINVLREAYKNSLNNTGSQKNNIIYENYPNWEKNYFLQYDKKGNIVGDSFLKMAAKSLTSPTYRMMTTIGRTRYPYKINNRGEVIITDTYDFPKYKDNSDFSKVHELGSTIKNPYTWSINLGNPKGW